MSVFRFSILIALASAAYVFAQTPAPTTPPEAPVRLRGSIGRPDNGSLESTAQLTRRDRGLLKLFPERNRVFGNQVTVNLVKKLGRDHKTAWPSEQGYERIQIGDVAQNGGGAITRHRSHQNGLDVDVVYLRNDHRETAARRGAEASFDEMFVSDGNVTQNFDSVRNWWVFEQLQASRKIDRIFVDPAIKRHLCNTTSYLQGERADLSNPNNVEHRDAVLRLLRPYPNHADHFHMRLKCPRTDTECVRSGGLPAGNGCNDVRDDVQDVEG